MENRFGLGIGQPQDFSNERVKRMSGNVAVVHATLNSLEAMKNTRGSWVRLAWFIFWTKGY